MTSQTNDPSEFHRRLREWQKQQPGRCESCGSVLPPSRTFACLTCRPLHPGEAPGISAKPLNYTTHLFEADICLFDALWQGEQQALHDGSAWAETDCILFVERLYGALTLRCVTAQVRRLPDREDRVLVPIARFNGAPS